MAAADDTPGNKPARRVGRVSIDDGIDGAEPLGTPTNPLAVVAAGDVAGTPVKFAKISAGSSGATAVVAAVTDKKIRVLGYAFTVSSAVQINFQDTDSNTFGTWDFAATGGMAYDGGPACPAFETAVGEGLDIFLSSTIGNCGGHLTYIEVD